MSIGVPRRFDRISDRSYVFSSTGPVSPQFPGAKKYFPFENTIRPYLPVRPLFIPFRLSRAALAVPPPLPRGAQFQYRAPQILLTPTLAIPQPLPFLPSPSQPTSLSLRMQDVPGVVLSECGELRPRAHFRLQCPGQPSQEVPEASSSRCCAEGEWNSGP